MHLMVECTDSRVHGGDEGVCAFSFAVGEDCDFRRAPTCLSSRVWIRVAASFHEWLTCRVGSSLFAGPPSASAGWKASGGVARC